MNNQDKTTDQLIAELAELRRRLAEKDTQLAKSQQAQDDQRHINDSLPVLVATAGVDGYYKKVNAAFERILGWSEEESLSRPFFEFIHPDDREAAVETFERLKAGETVTNFVDRNVCKDGSYRWFDWIVIPVLGRGIVFGIGQDITEKKVAEDERQRAERALQRANEELEERVKDQHTHLQRSNEELSIFRRFAEASGQGFGMADMDGYITYLNPAACRLAGVARPEDAIGQHLTIYYPEGYSLRRETEIVPAILQEGHWEGEITVPTGGKTLTVLQHSFLIPDDKGNPSRLASVITDITERKEVELALRTSEERFRSYFEQALIGMAVSTPERQWLEVNDRLCDILGYSRAELVGMKWTDATHPDDVEPGLVTFKRIVSGEIDHFTQEKRFIRERPSPPSLTGVVTWVAGSFSRAQGGYHGAAWWFIEEGGVAEAGWAVSGVGTDGGGVLRARGDFDGVFLCLAQEAPRHEDGGQGRSATGVQAGPVAPGGHADVDSSARRRVGRGADGEPRRGARRRGRSARQGRRAGRGR